MGFLNINKERKDQIIGFLAGIFANALGLFAYVFIFSKYSVYITLQDAYYKGYLSKLIALGGLLDLAVFFLFLHRDEDERAKGVLIASGTLALVILLLQFT